VVETSAVNAFALTGRTALVTGGGRGIGAGIARRFADAGAMVAVTARTAEQLDAVVDEVRDTGGRAVAIPADLTDLNRLPEVIARTVDEFGHIDVLVNNAGGGDEWRPFLDTRVEQLEAALRFNVSVPFELARLAVPHLLERPGASIINISSIAITKAVRGHIVYDAAKGALTHITRSMAADLGPRIRVNAILPGPTETAALRDYLDAADPKLRAMLIERTRLRRNGTVDDIAYAAVYLASRAGSWVTGKLFEVDGGAVDEIRERFPDL
jgi:7-alpha-hydroxysteroid dehydrogenase